jgi:hypothetical protein
VTDLFPNNRDTIVEAVFKLIWYSANIAKSDKRNSNPTKRLYNGCLEISSQNSPFSCCPDTLILNVGHLWSSFVVPVQGVFQIEREHCSLKKKGIAEIIQISSMIWGGHNLPMILDLYCMN